MAGMTDSAFRRLVKRHGGCGLVVTEMVSSEGLVRGIDRTLEFAEYTEEERPVSIQIFGGDPAKMADAAQIVESLGANIVDVNMGCPVPKIAKHNAGCSLMREPQHAASVIAAMTKRVKIPVTVKMRSGWNEGSVNAPELAKRVEGAGAAAVAVHGRTAAQSYSGSSDWDLIDQVAGAGEYSRSGLRRLHRTSSDHRPNGNRRERRARRPGRAAKSLDSRPSRRSGRRPADARGDVARPRSVSCWTTWICCSAKARAKRTGSVTPRARQSGNRQSEMRASHQRWVVNKLRALMSWYSKGLHNGGHLRTAINSAGIDRRSPPDHRGVFRGRAGGRVIAAARDFERCAV